MSARTNTSRPSFMHCNVCSVQAWWPSSLASQQQRFHHNWKVFVVYTGAASSIQARCASSCKLLSEAREGGKACGDVLCSSFDVKIAFTLFGKKKKKVTRSRLPSRYLRFLHVHRLRRSSLSVAACTTHFCFITKETDWLLQNERTLDGSCSV